MSVDLATRLELLVSELESMYPNRRVSTDAYLVNEPKIEELRRGLYSVVSTTGRDYRSTITRAVDTGKHGVMIIGRFELSKHATGSDVQDEELRMLSEIKALLNRSDLPEELTGGELISWSQSAQVEVPAGWIVFQLTFLEA